LPQPPQWPPSRIGHRPQFSPQRESSWFFRSKGFIIYIPPALRSRFSSVGSITGFCEYFHRARAVRLQGRRAPAPDARGRNVLRLRHNPVCAAAAFLRGRECRNCGKKRKSPAKAGLFAPKHNRTEQIRAGIACLSFGWEGMTYGHCGVVMPYARPHPRTLA
jgi:hypothetical protein